MTSNTEGGAPERVWDRWDANWELARLGACSFPRVCLLPLTEVADLILASLTHLDYELDTCAVPQDLAPLCLCTA